jgi:hypothetical protein
LILSSPEDVSLTRSGDPIGRRGWLEPKHINLRCPFQSESNRRKGRRATTRQQEHDKLIMSQHGKPGWPRVGTSGYQYEHWRGLFSPRPLPKKAWIAHYADHSRPRGQERRNPFPLTPLANAATFQSSSVSSGAWMSAVTHHHAHHLFSGWHPVVFHVLNGGRLRFHEISPKRWRW